MRRMRILLALAGAGLAAFAAARRPHEILLDERSAPYLEDAAVPRPVAAVRATLHERAGEVRLAVEVSATGDGVEPLPGLEGVQGANLRTAEELHALLRDGALALVTRQRGSERAGALHGVRTGRLPARRLRPDGSLDLHEATAAELPLAVTFRSADLPEGTSHTYVQAGGVPRLAVTVHRAGTSAHIDALESLGEQLPSAAVRKP
jgi:hypothetical protein